MNTLKNIVDSTIKEVIPKILARYPDLDTNFRIEYSKRLKTSAGIAYKRGNLMKLNVRLLSENLHHAKQTTLHELAHLIEYQVYGKAGHGRNWKNIMRFLGENPSRCHNLNVTKYRRKKIRYKYICSCNEVYHVTKGLHNRLRLNISLGRCVTCKSMLNNKFSEKVEL